MLVTCSVWFACHSQCAVALSVLVSRTNWPGCSTRPRNEKTFRIQCRNICNRLSGSSISLVGGTNWLHHHLVWWITMSHMGVDCTVRKRHQWYPGYEEEFQIPVRRTRGRSRRRRPGRKRRRRVYRRTSWCDIEIYGHGGQRRFRWDC